MDIATIDLKIGDELDVLNTIGTGGLKGIDDAEGSYTYSLLTSPESYNTIIVAWLSQHQGVGVMVPEYKSEDGVESYTINAGLKFGHYLVRPQSVRGTDILTIGFFEDGREGLELFGDNLAKEYDVKLKPKPEVYCTWYHRNLSGSGSSTEKDLIANTDYAAKVLKPFGLSVMQIDDNWQSAMVDGYNYTTNEMPNGKKLSSGPIKCFTDANYNFPNGMTYIADKFVKSGFVAGIWFLPFSGDILSSEFDPDIFSKRISNGELFTANYWSGAPIDATSPKGEAFLRKRFKTIYDWGYRYFKIDGLHSGSPSDVLYVNRTFDGKPIFADAAIYDKDKTFVECFKKGMQLVHEEAPEAFLLGCAATQNMSSFSEAFGEVDAMRVGPDNDAAMKGIWSGVTVGADYAGNLYFLHNRVWYNDPDPFYVRESSPLNCVQWMASWQAVSGVMGTTSMQYEHLPEERLDIIKRTLPAHTLNARPVDILESKKPCIWFVENDRMAVVGLFNWEEESETEINYDFKRLGLSPNKSYEVYDFWADEYLGIVEDSIHYTLKPATCQVLSVKEVQNYPSVISTSRHITQGLIDITSEEWNAASKTLQGCSKVVEGDRYEMRLIVPDAYKIKSVDINNEEATITQSGKIVRIAFTPSKSEEIEWKINF